MKAGRIVFLFLLCGSLLFGNSKHREYPCYRLAEAPILDGKAEEKAWVNIPEATGFYILGGEKFALAKQTYFKAGWSDKALYLYIKCEEPEINKISAKLKDGEELYREESIELFFLPEGAPQYFHLAVNPIGSRWNEIDASGQPGVPWDWQAKAYIGEDFWSVEVMIPFSVFGKKPDEGERWLVNIARNINTGPTSEHFTCWPPLKAGFHETVNFAQFVFRGQAPYTSEKIDEDINLPFYEFLRGEIDKIMEELSKNSTQYEEAIAYGLKKEKLRDEAIYLKEAWENLKNLASQKKPSLQSLRSFLLKNPAFLQRLKEFNYKVLMEKLFE